MTAVSARISGRPPASDLVLYATLIAYAAGLSLFRPRVLLIVDESLYVSQALAFAHGSLKLSGAGVVLPPDTSRILSDYPPGTSFLQAPLVWIGGWSAAAWLSLISFVLATLVMRRWLRDAALESGFALLVPAFVGSLFFARSAMSDMPSCAIVTLALWLLWRANSRARAWLDYFVSGLTAGLSLLFREPTVLVLAPFFIGAVIRRRSAAIPLFVGALLGIAPRLLWAHTVFANAMYIRNPGYGFSATAVAHNAPLYLAILLVVFPLGLLLPFLYRGVRRPEFTIAFFGYLCLFLAYDFDTVRQNGVLKGLILATRFVLPILPLLVFMAAEVVPRLATQLSRRAQVRAAAAARIAAVFVVAGAFGIHAAIHRMEGEQLSIVRALLENTSPRVPVITNTDATLKYFSPVYGPRQLIRRDFVRPAGLAPLLRADTAIAVAFLDRTDSELFRKDTAANAAFLDRLEGMCAVRRQYDRRVGNSQRLRVLLITHCA